MLKERSCRKHTQKRTLQLVLLKDDYGVVENVSLDVMVQGLKLRLFLILHIAALGSPLFDFILDFWPLLKISQGKNVVLAQRNRASRDPLGWSTFATGGTPLWAIECNQIFSFDSAGARPIPPVFTDTLPPPIKHHSLTASLCSIAFRICASWLLAA